MPSSLRELVRELIQQELEEASTTGNIAGYQTPHAFRSDEKDSEDELKLSAGMSVAKKLSESTYWDYRNDESMTTKQKLAKSMMNIRDSISMLERAVKYNVKLKNEIHLLILRNEYFLFVWKNFFLNQVASHLLK